MPNRETPPPEREPTFQQIIERHAAALERYLHPPYTYELPPVRMDRHEMLKDDPNYDYYLCRRNVFMMPLMRIDAAVRAGELAMTAEDVATLERCRDEILNLPANVDRTADEMDVIHRNIATAASILRVYASAAETH